ncbi:MAG: hypothetical protein ACR2QJ_10295 [Geminicoccaceae bacterium]
MKRLLEKRLSCSYGLRCHWFLAIAIGFFLAGPLQPHAETLEAGGLSFSDELGGFRLISATGSGRETDPIVLVEEFLGMGPAVLTIRRSSQADAGPPSNSVLQRSLLKVVINRSALRWSGFDLELRSDRGKASVYGDGLSFDQIRMIATPLHSDLFAKVRTEDEPYDRLRFDQGRVKPEQAVRLAFNLVDINPRPVFYLAQQPIVLLADAARRRSDVAAGLLLRQAMRSDRTGR